VFELLESLGGTSTLEHLQGQLQFSPSVLKSFRDSRVLRRARFSCFTESREAERLSCISSFSVRS
jgi:hypothetical protein